ncbi:MAG TPA: SRPBCC family protein [Acidimicrobiales bacterium]|nr:SRPBCC family protein [Acidimicrobiales bacterium]
MPSGRRRHPGGHVLNGAVAREVLIGIDDEARRLAYSVVDGPSAFTHHNASVQALPQGTDRTRLVWIADFLPDELSTRTTQLMEHGIGVIKQTLESQRAGR